jgi:hypothetical protein
MGRSRGGLTSKIHVVVDGNGLPGRAARHASSAHHWANYALCFVRLQVFGMAERSDGNG